LNADQVDLIRGLIVGRGGKRRLEPEEFLRQWGADDGIELGYELLADAVRRRSGDDVERAITVVSTFGKRWRLLPLLLELAGAEWHERHEDVISELSGYRTPEAIDALVHAVEWVPDYLDYDEARALAVKALWGLAAIVDGRAEDALERFAGSDVEVIADNAQQLLERRRQGEYGYIHPSREPRPDPS
jgi:hypothetical protein